MNSVETKKGTVICKPYSNAIALVVEVRWDAPYGNREVIYASSIRKV